ncbi:HEAT repeat domain-containing protein [Nonomuraea insulae]|uniref:HEAT repeat domain-containing protein n=1 Tax=Nonomuraea insulae TaxID=1616787 RepID=A0ABW1D2V3_9ACTN
MAIPILSRWHPLSSPHSSLRVTAIHYLRYAVGPGADELLSTALSDEKPAVRWTAVQVVGHLSLRHLQPQLAALLKTETDPTVLINLRRVAPRLAGHQS